jgi:Fe2+ transport system protein FeoA
MPEEPAFVARLVGHKKSATPCPTRADPSRGIELLMATGAPAERPLAELGPGDEGIVSRLSMAQTDQTDLRKLLALGVMPGVPIRVVRLTPSLVFELGFSEFAIDAELARSIMVRV